jgi:uncharacterized membrane protein
MSLIILYVATAVVFLALDALMLSFVMAPLFRQHLGEALLTDMRYVPAILFYLCYIAGLVFLVSWPALRDGAPVILPALVIGAMAYGTYEFTSYAVMKDWHPSMVAVDLTWGTLLTAFAAWAGVAFTRAVT